MAGKYVRWEDVKVRIYQDGREFGPVAMTDFSADVSLSTDSAKHQGEAAPYMDASFGGWSGSATVDMRQGRGDLMEVMFTYLDGLVNRTGAGQVEMLVSYVNPAAGETRAIRFTGVIPTIGIRGSESQKLTTPFQFQAERATFIR